ncbi:unnamed protein product [Ophioblennius macclurei]
MDLTLQVFLSLLVHLALADEQPPGPHCFPEHKVEEVARRKLQRYPQPPEPAASPPSECPLHLYAHLPRVMDVKERSLSPWRYEVVELPDHYPSSYVRAICLCKGCIKVDESNVTENSDFDSVTIDQSRIFLRREPCADRQSYRLVPVSLDVAVGCTCVRPKVEHL